jgi:hypothetical protein
VRGVLYWLLIRVALLLIAGAILRPPAGGGATAIAFAFTYAMIMALGAGILAYSEIILRRETIFIANLGSWPGWLTLIPALVAGSIEVIVTTLTRSF